MLLVQHLHPLHNFLPCLHLAKHDPGPRGEKDRGWRARGWAEEQKCGQDRLYALLCVKEFSLTHLPALARNSRESSIIFPNSSKNVLERFRI